MSSKTAKKDASFDALLNAATKENIDLPVNLNVETKATLEPALNEEKRGKGRPKKIKSKRQQLPTYLPEPLYFEMLDYVNLKKRSDRQYSLNDLVLEGLDMWLASLGKPTIQELINKSK